MMKSSTLLLTSSTWFITKLHRMMMVTFTRLLEIRIVASNFSGFARSFLTISSVRWLSNFSKSVSFKEKYAISEAETKAETHKLQMATSPAIMLAVVGALKEMIDCSIPADANINDKMHDNGSVSKI